MLKALRHHPLMVSTAEVLVDAARGPLRLLPERAQLEPVDPVHGHEQAAVHHAHVEHRDDVGVPEQHGHAALRHEQATVPLVAREGRRNDLDGAGLDGPLHAEAGRRPYLAHAALADAPHQRVAPEPVPFVEVRHCHSEHSRPGPLRRELAQARRAPAT